MYLVLSVSTLSVPDFKKLHSILGHQGLAGGPLARLPGGVLAHGGRLHRVRRREHDEQLRQPSPPRPRRGPGGCTATPSACRSLAARRFPRTSPTSTGSLSFFPYTIRPHPRRSSRRDQRRDEDHGERARAARRRGWRSSSRATSTASSGTACALSTRGSRQTWGIRLRARHRLFPAPGRAAAVRHHRRGERLPVAGRQQLLVVHAGGHGDVPARPCGRAASSRFPWTSPSSTCTA